LRASSNNRRDRLPPDVLIVTLLDEIAGRLADLYESLIPEGVVTPLTWEVREDNPWELILPKPCFSFIAYNTGPNPVYLIINKSDREYELDVDEAISIDMHAPKIFQLYFYVKPNMRAFVKLLLAR